MDHAILHGKPFSNPLIVDHRRTMQTRVAQELHQNVGVPLGPCGIEEAKQFQTYLADYQISIVSNEDGNKIIYAGPEKDKKIYLYMDNNHYDVITKMPGLFARASPTIPVMCQACCTAEISIKLAIEKFSKWRREKGIVSTTSS